MSQTERRYLVTLVGDAPQGQMPTRLRPYGVTHLGDSYGRSDFITAVKSSGAEVVVLVSWSPQTAAQPVRWHGPIGFGTAAQMMDFIDMVQRACTAAVQASNADQELEAVPPTEIQQHGEVEDRPADGQPQTNT